MDASFNDAGKSAAATNQAKGVARVAGKHGAGLTLKEWMGGSQRDTAMR